MSYEYEFRGFYPQRDKYCPVCGEILRLNDTVYVTPNHCIDGCENCMDEETAEAEGLDAIKTQDAWF